MAQNTTYARPRRNRPLALTLDERLNVWENPFSTNLKSGKKKKIGKRRVARAHSTSVRRAHSLRRSQPAAAMARAHLPVDVELASAFLQAQSVDSKVAWIACTIKGEAISLIKAHEDATSELSSTVDS